MRGFDSWPDPLDIALLRVVGQGEGQYDARRIDLNYSAHHPPKGSTILERLKGLERAGFVERLTAEGVGGRWGLTAAGAACLEHSTAE